MALKVEIEQTQYENIFERKGNGSNGPYHIRNQNCWMYQPGKKHPVEISIPLKPDQPAYQPGIYLLDVEPLLYQGQFNNLQINMRDVKLQPAK